MTLLGVDPGCRFAGFGIIKKEGGLVYLVDYGCLRMTPTKPLSERISQFHDFFYEKITTHNVTHLALETPFLGKNAQNFLKLGYLRGILYLLAHKNNLTIYEFSPREVKQAVTGFGGAQKDQVGRIIMQLFPRIQHIEREDVSDALAVTLCGLWKEKLTTLMK